MFQAFGQPHLIDLIALAVTQKDLGSSITLLSILDTVGIHHGGSTKKMTIFDSRKHGVTVTVLMSLSGKESFCETGS